MSQTLWLLSDGPHSIPHTSWLLQADGVHGVHGVRVSDHSPDPVATLKTHASQPCAPAGGRQDHSADVEVEAAIQDLDTVYELLVRMTACSAPVRSVHQCDLASTPSMRGSF